MNPECEKLQDFYAPYALGILGAEESRQLEEHLRASCPQCTPGVRDAVEESLIMGMAVPLQNPPSRVKEQLLARVARTRADVSDAWRWLAIAAMLMLAVLVPIGSRRIMHLKNELAAEREANTGLQQRTSLQQRMLQRQEMIMAYLRESNAALVPLKATSKDLTSGANAVLAPRGMLLMVHNLPEPTSDKTYQLWAIPDRQKPVSAGIFRTDQKGEAIVEVTSLPAGANKKMVFAVTLEPAGGMPQPTTTPILASSPITAP